VTLELAFKYLSYDPNFIDNKTKEVTKLRNPVQFKAVLQTSASAKYRRGFENENIGNIRESIEKYWKMS